MHFNLIHAGRQAGRHVGSKSSPAAPLKAVIYPASLHVFFPDDWLLSDPNPALERF